MQGITDGYGAAAAAVLAIKAGADVVLGPADIDPAFHAVLDAVAKGQISPGRLDRSVRRILEAKAWVGLHRQRFVVPDSIRNVVASPAHLSVSERVADASVTLLEDDGTLLPIRAGTPIRVVTVTETPWPDAGEEMAITFERSGCPVERRQVNGETGAMKLGEIAALVDSPGVTILGVYLSLGAWKGELRLPESLDRFVGECAGRPRVVLAALGDPYVLGRLPRAPVVVAAYSGTGVSERAVARALCGAVEWKGTLPVTIPGRYTRGSGITTGGSPVPLRSRRAR
jgi:beta-N-acetylhexosaminidase